MASYRISIHAPRVGSDRQRKYITSSMRTFQSTLPVWGATTILALADIPKRISIHAPRVGSDIFGAIDKASSYNFNPRSPCGERQLIGKMCLPDSNFNPRSPCGERPVHTYCPPEIVTGISIHAPRVGSDSEKTNILFEFSVFQCIICCFSKNTYTLMIEYHIGSRMKSAFFGANLSKKSVHLLFASKQDRVFRHICTFTAEVIYFALIPVSKVIEPQTVLFHIHYTAKFRLQAAALSCVQQAFKYRALNPLTIVDTLFGNLTQPLSSGCILCIYIIGN